MTGMSLAFHHWWRAFQHLKKQCCRVIVEPKGVILPD
jgi:hypothetical protein